MCRTQMIFDISLLNKTLNFHMAIADIVIIIAKCVTKSRSAAFAENVYYRVGMRDCRTPNFGKSRGSQASNRTSVPPH